MWETKKWGTRPEMLAWIAKHQHKFQIVEIFIHNRYAVEYKPLRQM